MKLNQPFIGFWDSESFSCFELFPYDNDQHDEENISNNSCRFHWILKLNRPEQKRSLWIFCNPWFLLNTLIICIVWIFLIFWLDCIFWIFGYADFLDIWLFRISRYFAYYGLNANPCFSLIIGYSAYSGYLDILIIWIFGYFRF